jgi:hypothetical protein
MLSRRKAGIDASYDALTRPDVEQVEPHAQRAPGWVLLAL